MPKPFVCLSGPHPFETAFSGGQGVFVETEASILRQISLFPFDLKCSHGEFQHPLCVPKKTVKVKATSHTALVPNKTSICICVALLGARVAARLTEGGGGSDDVLAVNWHGAADRGRCETFSIIL